MGNGQAANICASAQFPRGGKYPQVTNVKYSSGGKVAYRRWWSSVRQWKQL